ncbi:hypothetical protein CDIK_1982 [Cucumispora dikerogammari]|nr:hypothetical protein CDIK_1982 [Cucumispora dikerogammari]
MNLMITIGTIAFVLIGGSIVIFKVLSSTKKDVSATPTTSTSSESTYSTETDSSNVSDIILYEKPEQDDNSLYKNNFYQGESSETLSEYLIGVIFTPKQQIDEILSPATDISSQKIDNHATVKPRASKKIVKKTVPTKKTINTGVQKNFQITKGEELAKEMWFEGERSAKVWGNSLRFCEITKDSQYAKLCVFMKAVFKYPEDLESTMKSFYNFLQGIDPKTEIKKNRPIVFTTENFNLFKNFLNTDVSKALNFFFQFSKNSFIEKNQKHNEAVFKKAFVDTLNIIRSSKEYKDKLKTKKNSQKLNLSLFDNDDASKEEINFKLPIKIDKNIYRFDTLNLMMNNAPMMKYIIKTIKQDDATKLKYLMGKQFNYTNQAHLDYIENNLSSFIDFNKEPLEIIKDLLIKKRRTELEKNYQLCMGTLKFSLLPHNKKSLYQFEYDRKLSDIKKQDNETPELPLITIDISEILADKKNKQDYVSIQDNILDSNYFKLPNKELNTLAFTKMSFYVNQFPFLIVKIQETEALQQKDKSYHLECEKTLRITDINEAFNKYELTGFMMENKDPTDNRKSIFECFNFYNNKIQAVSRTDSNISVFLTEKEDGRRAKGCNIRFKIAQNPNFLIRYLLYKKV